MPNDLARDHWLETYKSLITISIEGFKFAALINGGAAVALLAYLGNVAGKSPLIADMRCPMAAFLAGLALCGLAMFVAYLTQFMLLNEIRESNSKISKHVGLLWTAFALLLGSLVFFGLGAWQAVIHFH